jgi:hypothetical protein
MENGEENLNTDIEKAVLSNDSVTAETKINVTKEEISVANLKEQEELYNVQYLIDNCKALGYKKEVVSGALLNCEKTQMTKSEFEETIKKFLGKRVK